jgi:hypothetical protein
MFTKIAESRNCDVLKKNLKIKNALKVELREINLIHFKTFLTNFIKRIKVVQ